MQGDRANGVHPTKAPSPRSLALPASIELRVPLEEAGPLTGARVLVVEDDGDSRDLICHLLEMAGAKVACVDSVAQAMDGAYQSFDPDVVLTDFSMPDANGFDLIREFRKIPSLRAFAVPILILSGHNEDQWRLRAVAAGAADVLTKPFDPTHLISRIAEAIAAGLNRPA